MKTKDMLLSFKHDESSRPPDVLWERLVWMAACLLRTAELERKTYRRPRGERSVDDPRQMKLFE